MEWDKELHPQIGVGWVREQERHESRKTIVIVSLNEEILVASINIQFAAL